MKPQENEQQLLSDDVGFDSVGVIISALRTRFGNAAATVAQRQAELAAPESATQWSAVVSRLSL
jgi:hypothetical protein